MLLPYQQEGAKWLATARRGLLADEPGLGKSAQAIEACNQIGARNVGIICPASVAPVWKHEISLWSDFSWNYQIASYDKVRTGAFELERVLGGFDTLILDEAHYLKSPKARRTQAIYGLKCDGVGGLVERTPNVFALSGTPMPNYPDELWPLVRALFPTSLLNSKNEPMTLWQFRNKFCAMQFNGFEERVIGGKNLGKLRERLAPHVLRRTKEQVLPDLPPLRTDILPVLGSDEAFRDLPEYQQARAAWELRGLDGLREIGPALSTLRRLVGMAKVPGVLSWLENWLEGHDKKIVLFAHHKDVVEALGLGLEKAGHRVRSIVGSTPVVLRGRAVEEFQRDLHCRVFIGQLQAAGTGITLTAASDLIFVESAWSPGVNEQAALRIHRIGQKNACLARFAVLENSLDHAIMRTCARKLADAKQLFS